MTDKLAASIDRLAAAVERLASAGEIDIVVKAAIAAEEVCPRCMGQKYLGHPTNVCSTCEGRGHLPAGT